MKRMTGLFALLIVVGLMERVEASDRTGVYAVIDRVSFSSVGTPDETIQVHGLFCLAEQRGYKYKPPVLGYMYYTLTKGKEEVCRKEWADFKRVAGTGQCIAFASRYRPKGRVRKSSEKPTKKPDAYPTNFGVRKMGSLDISKRKIRRSTRLMAQFNLAYCPRPKSPPEGAFVTVGKTPFVVDNVLANDKKARYYFEIKNATGETEVSGAIAPGEKQTRWRPRMKITAKGSYIWKAWVQVDIDGTSVKGPVATTSFGRKKSK